MKIDVYTTIYNEEIILPYFLRHYSSFADNIYVFYEESTDRTLELLKRNPKVTVFNVEKHGIDEGYWTTRIWTRYRRLSRGKADYVIMVDADEFVYHPKLVEKLEEEKAKGVQLIKCEGYSMFSESIPTTDGQIYDEIKDGLPDHWGNKPIIFDPAVRILFRKGRHHIFVKKHVNVVDDKSGIKLLHFRYFGKKYFEDRNRRNFSRFFINTIVPPFDPYNKKKHHQLPDGTRGNMNDWIETNKSRAVNVVDI